MRVLRKQIDPRSSHMKKKYIGAAIEFSLKTLNTYLLLSFQVWQ
jgi:hypothetical protein